MRGVHLLRLHAVQAQGSQRGDVAGSHASPAKGSKLQRCCRPACLVPLLSSGIQACVGCSVVPSTCAEQGSLLCQQCCMRPRSPALHF